MIFFKTCSWPRSSRFYHNIQVKRVLLCRETSTVHYPTHPSTTFITYSDISFRYPTKIGLQVPVIETLPLCASDLQTDHGAGTSCSPILPLAPCRDVAEVPVQKVDSQVEDITVLVIRAEHLSGQSKRWHAPVSSLFLLQFFMWHTC